jgi:hypothetical protein
MFGTGPGQIDEFNMTPIPDATPTIALCGMSAAALIAFRQRKLY